MKQLFLLLSITAILACSLVACNNGNRTAGETVSFYSVPLVCGAAPDIGCGSRSKPALLELEKNPAVKEAWLNREGTVVAIVWKERDQTEGVAKPVFDRNEISYEEITGNEAASLLKDFRKTNRWYKGADVDILSREEAVVIAESLVKWAVDSNLITTEEAGKIKTDAEAYFKEELVKIRTNKQLNEDSQNKFQQALFGISEKYIGKERTEKALALYQEMSEEQSKKGDECAPSGEKKDCCDK